MSKIFLAFPSYQVKIKSKIKTLNKFEFWNLDKIKDDAFVSLIKKKIKPLNKNIKNNYFFNRTVVDFKKNYLLQFLRDQLYLILVVALVVSL